jgi:ABC-type uncharacterized transport system substrate-binding protein
VPVCINRIGKERSKTAGNVRSAEQLYQAARETLSGGFDPVAVGLSRASPAGRGNLTGATSRALELAPKRLELLHELMPTATSITLLVDPANPISAETQRRGFQEAARILGLEPHLLNASSERDFETVFATVTELVALAAALHDLQIGTPGRGLAAKIHGASGCWCAHAQTVEDGSNTE